MTAPARSPGPDLAGLRDMLGQSARLWAARGRHEVEAGRWLALSGARWVDYNVIVVHGHDTAGLVARSLDDVRAAAVPCVMMLAGAGLDAAGLLAGAGWVCVGATAVMMRPIWAPGPGGGGAPHVGRLGVGELDQARRLIAAAFGVPPGMAEIALPDVAASDPGLGAWMLGEGGEAVACLATVAVDRTLVIWSMATSPGARRRGHGRRLLGAVLARMGEDGLERSLLYASSAGEPFYRELGYETVEHWQMWSRPRWVLGRA